MIEILSLWRNDAGARLEERARHLLGKTSAMHEIGWLWVIGDSTDDTLDRLLEAAIFAGKQDQVRIHLADTGITGEDTDTRRRRLSATATSAFEQIHAEAEYVLLHESDLTSPGQVVDRMLLAGAGAAIAGWPTIELGGKRQFYDTWAYRDLRGHPFRAHPPHSKSYDSRRVFEVGSFGSVWLAPAEMLRGRQLEEHAVLELCRQWRAEGHRLWCDPTIAIDQPADLWSPA